MEELRTYWQVPAVAHFCSLFRAVFKLIDFDIEDFEDALIVDTESAAEGGRSSLIVDVLTALLRGCLGRRDVTLLNYNAYLHDLLSLRWVRAGIGPNPLGEHRDRACFHILPLYAKVKILHFLCEWRLERPDVEVLTKDLNGDSLRVVPLGLDQKGSTYWYFYGTRLYREDVIVQPKSGKKTRTGDQDSKSTSRSGGRGRRKRKKRNYDFGSTSKKQKSSPKKRQRSRSSSVDSSVTGGNERKRVKLDESFASLTNDAASRETDTPTTVTKPKDEDDEDTAEETSFVQLRQWKPKLEPDLPVENASGSSSFPATPASAYSNTANTSVGLPSGAQQDDSIPFNDIIKRLYSRDDDDDEDDEKSDKRSNSNFPPTTVAAVDQSEETIKTEFDTTPSTTKMENIDSNETPHLKKPYIPEGPPPWDQAELTPLEPSLRGWSLVCATLEDWQSLSDSFDKPKGKCETDLCEILRRDFLPAMKDLFDQKEKERLGKLAELAPRRQSDRLEVKRLQKEREEKIFAEREKVELDRLAKIDDERQRRVDQEKREQRVRLRELEREKKNLIKERAREERSRRLELRQMRQQLIAEGKEIPEDLLNATGGPNLANDQELNELDIEIELEHMYGQLEKLLDQLKESEDAEPFMEPVKEEIAPDYYQVVANPMDFLKIEDKLFGREYKNKAEFVEDVNLVFLNCLHYNGLQSDYTKIAQRLERVFIKAWKKFFPPAELEESGEDARQEELQCISLLGALDKKIKEDLARVEQEEKNKFAIDKKELARQRKREADRRRRRIKADEKRAQREVEQQKLASQSLSSLSNVPGDDTPKRPSLPAAPFLVGRSNLRRPGMLGPPSGARPVMGSRLLPAGVIRDHTPVTVRQQIRTDSESSASSSPALAGSGGLRTYMPGISTRPLMHPIRSTPLNKRLTTPSQPTPGMTTTRLYPAAVTSQQTPGIATPRILQPGGMNQQMAPITVHSAGGLTTKVIRVSDIGILASQAKPIQATASGESAPGTSLTAARVIPGSVTPKPMVATPGNTFLLNTGSGGARLVRLVAQDGQAISGTRIIPARLPPPVTGGGTLISPPPGLTVQSSTTAISNNQPSTSGTASTPSPAAGTPAKEGVVTLSSISKNLTVSIKDKLAYFTKKDEATGEYKTVGPVDKDTLVRKLAVYQQQRDTSDVTGSDLSPPTSSAIAPKPVCSVAPVRQLSQQRDPSTPDNRSPSSRPLMHSTPKPGIQTTLAPVSVNNAYASGSGSSGQTVLVSGNQQFVLLPSQQPQVITIAGGSYILASNQSSSQPQPTPIYIAASAGSTATNMDSNATAQVSTAPGVQLIQVMPQIIVNPTTTTQHQQLVQQRPASQQNGQGSSNAGASASGTDVHSGQSKNDASVGEQNSAANS